MEHVREAKATKKAKLKWWPRSVVIFSESRGSC
jgi:hypothetical protein